MELQRSQCKCYKCTTKSSGLGFFFWIKVLNKSINQQVNVFNRTVMNIFSNFISNKFVIFIKDRDPPWMTANIKDKINYRNNIYRKYLKKGKQQVDYIKLQSTIKKWSKLILTRRDDYNRNFPNKLIDPTISSKAYWSVMKTFYNCKKNPYYPSLVDKW